jgi:hypothetical protein
VFDVTVKVRSRIHERRNRDAAIKAAVDILASQGFTDVEPVIAELVDVNADRQLELGGTQHQGSRWRALPCVTAEYTTGKKMDPNENMHEQLSLALRILNGDVKNGTELLTDATRLAELVIAMDGWLRSGGFMPGCWTQPAAATKAHNPDS